jgi:uncharacterized membrane protein
MQQRYVRIIHRAFEIGILLKGVDGLLEIIGGILFFLIPPTTINYIVRVLTQGELSEDPRDLIANFLVHSAHNLSLSGETFGGIFLLSHGIIKIGLVIALFKRKLWAYPLAMVLFGMFIVYQMYRYAHSHSLWMIFLSLLDAAVVLLTYLEYRNLKYREMLMVQR